MQKVKRFGSYVGIVEADGTKQPLRPVGDAAEELEDYVSRHPELEVVAMTGDVNQLVVVFREQSG